MTPLLQQALVAWPLIASSVFIFGSTAYFLAVAPNGDMQREGLARAFLPIWCGLSLLMALVSPVALMVEVSSIAARAWSQTLPLIPMVMRETHVGRMWCWRLGATAMLLVAAWVPFARTVKAGVLCALAASLLLMTSLSSHAVDHGAIAVAIHFSHEAAAGLWLGAIVALWLGGTRARLGDEWVERAAPGVSRVAGWSVAALVATGLYTAYDGLGLSLDHLLYSAYGRTLLLKVAIFLVAVSFGGYNRYTLLPAADSRSAQRALMRNVAVETVLLIAVLGMAALLANTPPAH
jgi:copper resistance protein D